MTTTASLLLKIAERLRPVYYGTATGGSTTTLVDTSRAESNSFFDNGTIFLLTGNNAGKTAKVTSYNSTTHTFTIPTQAGACAAGDQYAVVDRKYTRDSMVAALNLALGELGPFDQINESLTTVVDQERYTLPASVYNVLRVLIATSTTSPYEWEGPYKYWRERDGYLYFDDQHLPTTAGYPIRLYYQAAHSRVSADADTVTNEANPELIAVLAAIHAARIRAGVAGTSDPEPNTVIQLLTPQYMSLQRQHPIRRMQKDSRYPGAIPSADSWDEDRAWGWTWQ